MRQWPDFIVALIAVLVGSCSVLAPARLPTASAAESADSAGALYLVGSGAMGPQLFAVPHDAVCDEPNLVIITHGWYERQSWAGEMALAIARNVDRRNWQCGWYDWRPQAKRLRPYDATKIGRERIGPALAEQILQLSKGWRHVHLIGHSAGAWVVSAAATIITDQTHADMHITFLDAFVPSGWDEQALGKLACDPPRRCWVDHYFTRDLFRLTENVLTYAHNVDITDVNPGFNGHRFPIFWYQATIASGYMADQRFIDEPVRCDADGVTYGFARTRESGARSWMGSTALRPADEPVRIGPQANGLQPHPNRRGPSVGDQPCP